MKKKLKSIKILLHTFLHSFISKNEIKGLLNINSKMWYGIFCNKGVFFVIKIYSFFHNKGL